MAASFSQGSVPPACLSAPRCRPVLPAGSGGQCNTSASASDGVWNPRVCRGRPLSSSAIVSRSAWVRVRKTTLARRLRAGIPDLAIVSQDVVRREILGTRDVADNPSIGLIDLVARYALDRGRHVVVEGILNAPRYGAMLRALVADHRGTSRAYVMDVPFEETLR